MLSKRIKQARKASLLSKTIILGLPVDIVLKLFNVCIVPILLYGANILGYENIEELEVQSTSSKSTSYRSNHRLSRIFLNVCLFPLIKTSIFNTLSRIF